MESSIALRMREEPGFGAKVKRCVACLGIIGTREGEVVEERGAGPELEVFRWETARLSLTRGQK